MDKLLKLWGLVRPLVTKVVPWGMATQLLWAIGITAFVVWGLTAAGCNKWHAGKQDAAWAQGCRQCAPDGERIRPVPDDNVGPFRRFFRGMTGAWEPPAAIERHEQYDGEPELMEAPR